MNSEEIFHSALAKPLAERPAFLAAVCAGDELLQRRVEALLQAHENPASFLAEQPHLRAVTIDDPVLEHPGAVIDWYKLIQEIGEGGMGTVWMAQQTEPVKRAVALKVIKPGMDSKQILARFEAERQALALMDHPNIARVFDAGATATGRPYFVMELIKGVPITKYCDEQRLTPKQRLELFIPVCHAIQHAHQKGIIHRDIKPSNILIAQYDGNPVPKVIDFGVAKATGQQLTDKTMMTGFGSVVGTLEYMSPEQAELNQLDVDTRSDIYSLGVVLYELLTGSTPLDRKRLKQAAFAEVLRIIREEEPPKPSTRLSHSTDSLASVSVQRQMEPAKLTKLVRGELDWIVMKALEKNRNRRYETANGFAMDVQRYLADEQVLACPPSAGYRLKKFARKYRAALTTAAAIFLLLVAGVAVSIWQAVRATRAEVAALNAQRAEAERAEGEKDAKQQALAAVAAEKDARMQAQLRLAQIEKGNEIITAIFTDLDIRKVKRGTEPLEAVLAKRLVKAAEQLEGEAVGDPVMVALLQDRLGTSLLNLGYAPEAVRLFVKALDTRAAKLGANDIETLTSMNNLAQAYQDAGMLDLALPLLQQTHDMMKTKLGVDDPRTLCSMSNLARGYQAAGNLDLALPLFKETLKRMKAKLSPDHSDMLQTMNNLAACYQADGKLDLALPLYEETLARRKATLGADDPDTLTSMNNLAEGYRAAGKLDRALPLLEETLKLTKAKLGANHPDTLISMSNLASCYRAADKLELALPLYEETFKRTKAQLGTDHLDTLTSMSNLASGYQAAGNFDLALPLFEETLKLRKVRLGADHPDTLVSTNNLASAYFFAGKLDLAQQLLEETLKRQKAKIGADHPDALTIMGNLASCYQAAGKLDRALPLFQEAVAGIEKQRFEHEYAGRIIGSLIDCHERLEQFDQAENWRRKWLAIVKERSGSGSPPYAGELAALGKNLLQQKKWTDAESALRECLDIREKTQPEVWSTFNTKSLLGGALLGQQKYADAEPLLLAGYEGMRKQAGKIPSQGRARVPEALARLIQLYQATDKKDDVAKWQKELNAIKAAQKTPEKKQ